VQRALFNCYNLPRLHIECQLAFYRLPDLSSKSPLRSLNFALSCPLRALTRTHAHTHKRASTALKFCKPQTAGLTKTVRNEKKNAHNPALLL